MTTVTVRSYHMADRPRDEAIATERALWSAFGEIIDPEFDGQSGHTITHVTVRSDHAMQSLQAAVRQRATSKITAPSDTKDPA